MLRVVDYRPGQRDPPGVLCLQVVSRHQPAQFEERRVWGKRDAVWPSEPIPNATPSNCGSLGAFQPEAVPQLRLVPRRRHFRLQLTLHAVNLLRSHRYVVQHRLARHPGSCCRGGPAARERSSTHHKSNRSHGMRARHGCAGSASSANAALGVDPPLIAILARPRAATARSANSTKYRAARRASACCVRFNVDTQSSVSGARGCSSAFYVYFGAHVSRRGLFPASQCRCCRRYSR